MKQKFFVLLLVLAAGLTLMASNSDADFVQCPGPGICEGTEVGDIINGTPDNNEINGMDGDDSIFAGDNPPVEVCPPSVMDAQTVGGMMFGGFKAACPAVVQQGVYYALFNGGNGPEFLLGGLGNDFISGGPGSDVLLGEEGDDVLLPGPDDGQSGQAADGGSGNDAVFVFAGEISSCLGVWGSTGSDSANLFGFGPYSLQKPYNLPNGVDTGLFHVQDPIAGGDIFIFVDNTSDNSIDFINGLPTPNPAFFEELPVTGCSLPIK